MSKDEETRQALWLCIALLNKLRGRIRNTYEPSWIIAMSALFVLADQHDGKYPELQTEKAKEGRW